MKSVLISIRPKWCELIANGQKTVEIRKTKPKLDPPFKVYIYCTGGPPYLNSHNGCCYLEERDVLGHRGTGLYCRLNNGVIGEFVCDKMLESFLNNNDGWFVEKGCLTPKEIDEYQGDKAMLYGWHISELVIYDHPKKLSEFRAHDVRTYTDEKGYPMPTHEMTRPPQSWCYVEEGGAE